MRNIDLNARLADMDKATAVCEKIGTIFQGDIRQTDTYFDVPAWAQEGQG